MITITTHGPNKLTSTDTARTAYEQRLYLYAARERVHGLLCAAERDGLAGATGWTQWTKVARLTSALRIIEAKISAL